MKKFPMLTVLIIMVLFMAACAAPRIRLFSDAGDPLKEYTLEGSGPGKVLLIPVQGIISDTPRSGILRSQPSLVQTVMAHLKKAEKDKDIKAVLLKVNSPGGTITASDLLYHEISSFKQRTGKKIIVVMMDLAASGAYYLSLPADMLIAHPTTLTGSVGVVFLQPNVRGLMDKLGLKVEVRKFGENKDMGSPFRESSEEEQKILQKTVDDFGSRFSQLVQKHRRLNSQALQEVFTGRIFPAEKALQLGLVDKTGYLSDAIGEAKRLAGLREDDRLVVYRRTDYPDDTYYNTAGIAADNLSLPVAGLELPSLLHLPVGYYYLWPGALATEQ